MYGRINITNNQCYFLKYSTQVIEGVRVNHSNQFGQSSGLHYIPVQHSAFIVARHSVIAVESHETALLLTETLVLIVCGNGCTVTTDKNFKLCFPLGYKHPMVSVKSSYFQFYKMRLLSTSMWRDSYSRDKTPKHFCIVSKLMYSFWENISSPPNHLIVI